MRWQKKLYLCRFDALCERHRDFCLVYAMMLETNRTKNIIWFYLHFFITRIFERMSSKVSRLLWRFSCNQKKNDTKMNKLELTKLLRTLQSNFYHLLQICIYTWQPKIQIMSKNRPRIIRVRFMGRKRYCEFRVYLSMDDLSPARFRLERTIYHINLPQRGSTTYQRENR